MRQRRALLGTSQSALGDAIGSTFQRVQKYERSANRISASRLVLPDYSRNCQLARVIQEANAEIPTGPKCHSGQASPRWPSENLELVRAYYGAAPLLHRVDESSTPDAAMLPSGTGRASDPALEIFGDPLGDRAVTCPMDGAQAS